MERVQVGRHPGAGYRQVALITGVPEHVQPGALAVLARPDIVLVPEFDLNSVPQGRLHMTFVPAVVQGQQGGSKGGSSSSAAGSVHAPRGPVLEAGAVEGLIVGRTRLPRLDGTRMMARGPGPPAPRPGRPRPHATPSGFSPGAARAMVQRLSCTW